MPSIVESARWAAAQRGRESARSDRLFFDPLAAALAGEDGFAALQLSEKYNPQHVDTANYISIRIRFFDDTALKCSNNRIRQFGLPAAGMDARAYRLPWPDGTMFYELDHSVLFAMKEDILGRQGFHSTFRQTIRTDLKHNWARLVVDTGFASDKRSMWIVEGLFYYLEEADVHHVLAQASSLGCTRERDGDGLRKSECSYQPGEAMEERRMGWRFGTDDPAALFAQHGWEAEVKHPEEEGAKYDSQRFPRHGGGATSFFVVARKR